MLKKEEKESSKCDRDFDAEIAGQIVRQAIAD